MKISAIVCVLIVCATFAGRVSAQTYTPGELRATAIMANAQVIADAQRRRTDAPTSTPRPTPTETETPEPTATRTPTGMPTETATPTMVPTVTQMATASATVQPTATPVPAATIKRNPMTLLGILIMFGILIGAGVAVFL